MVEARAVTAWRRKRRDAPHWAVLDGRMMITIDETTATLDPGDIALIRTGATRLLRSLEHGRAVVCRE